MSVFVKIENKEITVVVDNDKHDTTLANNIMRSVQENFKEKRYITVQFKQRKAIFLVKHPQLKCTTTQNIMRQNI